MSDLRDFTPARDDSMARFADEPMNLNEPANTATFVDDGGLGNFHISGEAEELGSRRSKLIAGAAVAVLVAIGGGYAFTTWQAQQPVVADENLPSPSAPTKTAAMTPPPAPAPAAQETAPSATMPAPAATAPVAPDVVKPAPATKEASVSNAPKVARAPKAASASTMTAPATRTAEAPPVNSTLAVAPAPAPVQNQASNVPEPVSPTPPASAVAGNPPLNEQSADQTQADQQAAQPTPQAPQAAAPAQPEAAPPQPQAAPTVQPANPVPASPAQ